MRSISLPTFVVLLGACAAPPPPAPAPVPVATPTENVAAREFEAEIDEFESADRRDPKAAGGVVFVGSSSIRLWPMLEEDFPRAHIIHRGFGGSQLDDVIHYTPRIVTKYQPRLIVLYAGDNDLNAGKTPAAVFRDYQRFINLVWSTLPKTRIAFVSIKPSEARWAIVGRMRETNEMVRRHAASDPRLVYVDVFNPMLGPNGRPRAELFVTDQLHLSEKGYALWRQILRPIVEP